MLNGTHRYGAANAGKMVSGDASSAGQTNTCTTAGSPGSPLAMAVAAGKGSGGGGGGAAAGGGAGRCLAAAGARTHGAPGPMSPSSSGWLPLAAFCGARRTTRGRSSSSLSSSSSKST